MPRKAEILLVMDWLIENRRVAADQDFNDAVQNLVELTKNYFWNASFEHVEADLQNINVYDKAPKMEDWFSEDWN